MACAAATAGNVTALGVTTGSAGAPVLFNGAGGTPSSMTGTNITGIPNAAVAAPLYQRQAPAQPWSRHALLRLHGHMHGDAADASGRI